MTFVSNLERLRGWWGKRTIAVVLGWVLGGLAPPARGDIVISSQRLEDRPWLVLNTGGPTGLVRAAAFAPDSSRVYVGGLGKAIQAWTTGGAQERAIRRSGMERPVLVQTLRWEIARGPRGIVYAMAASPVDRRLAVGGYSARDQLGLVVVFDTATGDVEAALDAHRQTIVGLAFSPDGKRLASASLDGEIRVWDVPPARDPQERSIIRRRPAAERTADEAAAVVPWKSVQVRKPRVEWHRPLPVEFLSNQVLATADWKPGTPVVGSVVLYDLSQPRLAGTTLEVSHPQGVQAFARDRGSDRWASADGEGNVILWTGVERPVAKKFRQSTRLPTALAFAPNDTLFIANLLDSNKQAVLECWNVATGELVDQAATATTENNFVCAVSADGTKLVTTNGDDNEVWLFSLVDRDGARLPRPLSQPQLARMAGSGQKIWKVAFADDDSGILGFGVTLKNTPAFNDVGELTHRIDLKKLELQRLGLPNSPDPPAWRHAARTMGRWEFGIDPQQRHRCLLFRSKELRSSITLDPEMQGNARSFCWIAGADGEPVAIAIGTDLQNGIFVYRVVDEGECPLLRYFRDHTGWVTSLSVSKDGRYLASASVDQTVKLWSLSGLLPPASSFAKEAGWGAAFERKDGHVVLTRLDDAGIAAQRGLRRDDVILEATFGEKTSARLGEKHPFTTKDPGQILRGLNECPLTETLVVTLQRSGRPLPERILIVPAWEPVATLFVDREGSWAFWTPQGYYDASVAGDELFGWQLNRGLAQRPAFFRADQFRDALERPDVMRRLFAAGNLRAALREANEIAVVQLDRRLPRQLQNAPEVTILEPTDGYRVKANEPLRVVAEVSYRGVENPDAAASRVYLNGVPGGNPRVIDGGTRRIMEWNLTPTDVFNRVRVTIDTPIAEEQTQRAFADVFIESPAREARKARVHILALAAQNYPGKLALRFAKADADGLIAELTRGREGLYEIGIVRELFDHDITRPKLAHAIAEFRKAIGDVHPSDLFILFAAGHGVAFDKEYYFIPPDESLSALSTDSLSDTTLEGVRKTIERVGIPWKQLRELADIPCRRVFLLDTCFAGNILLAEQPSANWKAAIRPFARDEVLVISATDINQSALENEGVGHGVFTKCILDGLRGAADRRKNGDVDVEELASYVETEVPSMTGSLQTPTSTPRELMGLLSIPLVRYSTGGAP